MGQLRRGDKVMLCQTEENSFEVLKDGAVVINQDEDFYSYFFNVNLKPDGVIQGKYMGEASDTMVDSFCKNLVSKEDGWYDGNKKYKTAKMLIVHNKTKVVIVVKTS